MSRALMLHLQNLRASAELGSVAIREAGLGTKEKKRKRIACIGEALPFEDWATTGQSSLSRVSLHIHVHLQWAWRCCMELGMVSSLQPLCI